MPQNTRLSSEPARVIVKQALVLDQGVRVEWLKGIAGNYPISGYVIERSRSDEGFIRVAQVENISLEYLDSDGQIGDRYRVLAEDNQRPAHRSLPSEPVVATTPEPGSQVVTTPPALRVLAASTITGVARTPDEKATTLRDILVLTFREFNAAMERGATTAAKSYLHSLQGYFRETLSLLPQLSETTRLSLGQMCAEQLDAFEAHVYGLVEQDRMDGLLVHASCGIIQEAGP